MHYVMPHSAFTLIELLVVITIIVVLLALLTPALDKAIYQAELTVCGTRMKTLATGASVYAVGNRRQYPRTSPMRGTQRILKQGVDMRPLYESYVSINGVFNEALLPDVDFVVTGRPTTWLWTPIRWFAGYGIPNQGGMFKIGDRMGFNTTVSGQTLRLSFNVLVGDAYFRSDSGGGMATSHPDHNGVMHESVVQDDRPEGEGAAGSTAADAGAIDQVTLTEFLGPVSHTAMEMNFAYQDGSVNRLNDVQMGRTDIAVDEADDERLVRFPYGGGTDVTNVREHLPLN